MAFLAAMPPVWGGLVPALLAAAVMVLAVVMLLVAAFEAMAPIWSLRR